MGNTLRITSSSTFSRYAVMEVAAVSMLRWVSITPLGSPVLPDVYTMAAKSTSMLRRTGGAARDSPDRTSSQAATPGKSRVRLWSTVPEMMTVLRWADCAAASAKTGVMWPSLIKATARQSLSK